MAESFGDLDPRLDLREADLEAGQEWTGWHRIEKDLWPEGEPAYTAATPEERAALADQLVADTQELYDRTRDLTYTADQLGNGAKALLDEVATGKVTGEEEGWSHTDLWDFQANVDGARIAFEDLRPRVEVKDPDLATLLDERFAALQALLDEQREGDGFVLYTELSDEQIKALVGLRQRPQRATVAAHGGRRAVTDAPRSRSRPRPPAAPPTRWSRRRRVARRRRGGAGVAGGRRPRAAVRRRRRRRQRQAATASTRSTGCTRRASDTGPGPAALRRVRRDDDDPATSSSPCCGVDRRRRAHDAGRSGRVPSAGQRPVPGAARRHRRGARAAASRLTLTFGFGPTLFRDADGQDRFGLAAEPGRAAWSCRTSPPTPSTLRVRAATCACRRAPTTPRSPSTPSATSPASASARSSVRWSQLGFGRTSSTSTSQATPRNLFGFKDGTANIKAEDPAALAEHVWVAAGDDPAGAWMRDGTYLVARRINMHIETWDRGPLREQEAIVGREKGEGAPLSGGTEFSELDFAAGSDGAADRRRLARPPRPPVDEQRRPAAPPRLQLRRRQRRPRPPRRRPLLPRLHP